MRYIISERQYRLLTEDEDRKILKLPSIDVFGDWEGLQSYLNKKGNPLFSISGNLDLYGTNIKSLDNLVSVEGYLDLRGTPIKSLDNLVSVGGNFKLWSTPIKSLNNLVSVGGNFVLYEPVKSIGNLVSVGGDLDLSYTNIKSLNNLKYVGGNLILTGTPLSKTTTEEEIRQQVEVGGNIYLKWNT